MIIAEKLNNRYKNQIENIKKEKNRNTKLKLVGALVADVGGRCIQAISKVTGCCRAYIKKAYLFFIGGCHEKTKQETRVRKRVEKKFPEIINQVKEIVSNYESTDPHFKTETLYVDLTLNNLRNELIKKYNYCETTCPCRSTLLRILKDLGYKLNKVKKTKVLDKVPETDTIFENIKETKKCISLSGNEVIAISVDDKNRKKIGAISDNGYSQFEREALDHDTNFNCSVVPFGILDLKTNKPYIYCNKGSSTADFKVDCIEDYLIQKKAQYNNIKRLIIFLDNGPENSSRRTLWIKRLIELSIKYNIAIELVYYPPYHSKYNMIERYWARLQLSWNGLIIDSIDRMVKTINKVTWKGEKSLAVYVEKKYKKGITVDKYEMYKLEKKHVYREEGIEKWSLVITP